MRENVYQARLIKKLEHLFPGCLVLKNDPNLRQGIPDLTILYRQAWAFLEVKTSAAYQFEPNQEYWVSWAAQESFGAVVFPENEAEVLDALQRAF